MNKKLKTIDIKGKEYVTVAERVRHFNETYTSGKIVTELLSDLKDKQVVMVAKVTPDVEKPERYFTGYSQEIVGEGMVNKTSALENAETSAVGRALGLMGIGIVESIASVDEVNKATNRQNKPQVHRAFVNGKVGKCGHKLAVSKEGKEYCSLLCWLPETERAKKGLPPLEKVVDADTEAFNKIAEQI